ncbi:precorrin-3B synthase [Bradyrhizobium sp. 180]|uniref:precorrin-3B synthase n=1 Tax=unclassified Bradyrhizobium TaxID=2631580 RepID=UPI001FF87342|nr:MULTISPECIES: precorrin-3B synthase [unclassified Bradyrhizobium]MCK1421769.1 precorrin-3B synthase [Bradyrhizobium sp. CW12]MCK1494272.1 precorrin-3B synthase [Bradyrhizobium sp. 180]MCK1530530.1 precorrin-3B synthase [Bradyrhizobium sp. 182]MCK1594897.1 precorrin-3B synthase [Bradyrhizobium sp. 164]MCK1615737.1 precorrin-3B synthase [Bradyrhizobium sp. 159]
MSASAVKGWCPGALRPMQSGDGLVVRVRPFGGRLEAAQASGLADLAERFGNGLLDVTSRANLQIRGVRDEGHGPLLDGLARLALLDPDADIESRRNILVTPFWNEGDDTQALAAELEEALADSALKLPTKFGFAIDDGTSRVLAGDSADVRIERDRAGRLLVRADGASFGRSVGRGDVVSTALALADWFITSGGVRSGRGRMAAHIASGAALPGTLRGETEPASVMAALQPGHYPQGAMVGVAFGQMLHTTLHEFAGCGHALRMTPWRMVLSEGKRAMPNGAGLITEPYDPALRVIACSGAPRCREAHADTRALAAALAPRIAPDTRLHVSGCAKGCAHSGATAVTLVATGAGFDLVRGGSARDEPALRGLNRDDIVSDPSILVGGH